MRNTYSSNINAVSSRVSWTACKLMICCELQHSISTAISWLISLLRHWSRRRRRKNLAAYLTPVFLCITRLTVPNFPLKRNNEKKDHWLIFFLLFELIQRQIMSVMERSKSIFFTCRLFSVTLYKKHYANL